MSTLKVNKLRDTAGSTDAIVLDPNGGAVLAGVTTISTARITTGITTSIQVGGGVTISESGIEASGIGITCASINGTQIGGRRNMFKNGAMIVSQRGTTFTSAANGEVQLDGITLTNNTDAVYTVSQSTTSPDGFGNSWKIVPTTADTSLTEFQMTRFSYVFEGQDLQQLAKGTSSAKEGVISFYVKTNKTGVYSLWLYDADNTRYFANTYTVSDTNWNRYAIVIPADTTGAYDNDNAKSLVVVWALALGSGRATSGTNPTTWGAYSSSTQEGKGHTATFADSTSNEFYITGIQYEVGSQATPFEHRSFGEELSLCQRYFYPFLRGTNSYENIALGFNYNSTTGIVLLEPPVEMRDTPSLTSSGTIGADDDTSIGFTFEGQSSKRCFRCNITNHSKTSGQGFQLRAHNSTTAKFELSAELAP